jgi:hypothetical protein
MLLLQPCSGGWLRVSHITSFPLLMCSTLMVAYFLPPGGKEDGSFLSVPIVTGNGVSPGFPALSSRNTCCVQKVCLPQAGAALGGSREESQAVGDN